MRTMNGATRTQAKDQAMNDILEAIARKHLGIETLKERFMDDLDFHEVHVGSLREALLEAYRAGQSRNE